VESRNPDHAPDRRRFGSSRFTPIRGLRVSGRRSTMVRWSRPGRSSSVWTRSASSNWPVRCAITRAKTRVRFRVWKLRCGPHRQGLRPTLYKLWGAAKDRVPAYASMIQLSTPEERVRMAVQLKSEGWKAIELRAARRPSFFQQIRPASGASTRKLPGAAHGTPVAWFSLPPNTKPCFVTARRIRAIPSAVLGPHAVLEPSPPRFMGSNHNLLRRWADV